MRPSAIAILAIPTLIACSKSTNDAPSGAGSAARMDTPSAAAKAPEAKAAGPKVVTFGAFGLKGTAEGETEDPIIGTGSPALIMFGHFTVTIDDAKPTDPKTIKEGQEAAKMFNPKDMKTETLSDGWALTYKNTGSAGENFFVNVRRDIGGKAYTCETTQNTAEQQKLALAFCKSLAK
jgi:hypothetical protein